MNRTTLAAALLLASTATATLPAKADTFVTLGGQQWNITNTQILSLTAVVPGGNQPLNVQCIICGENQPQQSATFGYTDFHNAGNQTSEVYFSTQVPGGANPGTDTVGIGYDGSFLRAYLPQQGSRFRSPSVSTRTTPTLLNVDFVLHAEPDTAPSAGSVSGWDGRQHRVRAQRYGFPGLYPG